MAAPSLDSDIRRYTRDLYDSYEAYKVKDVTSKRFKHSAMMDILHLLQASMKNILRIEQIGVSSEGRSINLLTIGSGKKKIFMWSQMHGDEPTATMGVLDMLSYIGQNQA